jgi:prefoldin subunit 5
MHSELVELQQDLADLAAALNTIRAQVKALLEQPKVLNLAVVTDSSGQTQVRVD